MYGWTFPVPPEVDTFPRQAEDYSGMGVLPQRLSWKKRKKMNECIRCIYDMEGMTFVPATEKEPKLKQKREDLTRPFPICQDEDAILNYVVSVV